MTSSARNAAWILTFAVLAVLAAGGGSLAAEASANQAISAGIGRFLDVGDGDCALLRTVDGTTLLVDTGGKAHAPETLRLLRQLHVKTIDLLVLAGPDDGNLGAVPAVLNSFAVRAVWDGAPSGTGAARQAALKAIRDRHIPSRIARAGDHLQIGAATFWTAIWPTATSALGDRLVCRMDFGRTRLLLAGATDGPTEDALLESDASGTLRCSADTSCTDLVLQAGTQTSAELLWQAAPSVAVISCGAAEGQTPRADALARRVEAAGTALWRTDTQGTVVVRMDGRTPPAFSVGLLK